MPRIVNLAPHDPLPDQSAPHVLVMRRFGEDDPHVIYTEVTTTRGPGRSHSAPAVMPDGRAAELDDAIMLGKSVAERERIEAVYVVDRTAGPRERAVIERNGDHSVGDAPLDDDDMEDGERGSDMRDRRIR
jgi:hypothetical protein